MSEYIQVLDYPNLREEHLEILPNLSLKIQYQDIPTVHQFSVVKTKPPSWTFYSSASILVSQILKPDLKYPSWRMMKHPQRSERSARGSTGLRTLNTVF